MEQRKTREREVVADDIYIGGKQIPNPKGIKPLLDTDNPPAPKMPGARMDISNPHMAELIPRDHPVDSLFTKPKTVRHQIGRYVPKVSTN